MPTLKRHKTNYPGVTYISSFSTLTKKPERIYYITYRKDGKLIEEKAGRQYKDDMTAAKANAIRSSRIMGVQQSNNERRMEEERKRRAEETKWTFNRLWEEYKARRTTTKSLDVDEYRYTSHIKPTFGEKEPHAITHADIDKLRSSLSAKKKPQTVKHVLAQIRRISNFAVNKNLCAGIPFNFELPRVNNKKTEDLSPAQLKSLLEVITEHKKDPAAQMMQLALYTGMRRTEMFRLKWNDIDFQRGFINIRDPKGGQDQVIPLNNTAREILKSIPQSSNPLVFPDDKGEQRYQITREANRIKEAAGIPKEFRALHGLRHVYASMLASSGKVDMYTLQKLLTHKSPVMTQRYAHLRDDTLKRASNLTGDLIDKALKEAKEAEENKAVSGEGTKDSRAKNE